jgi:predicted RNA-binding protein with PIN domain
MRWVVDAMNVIGSRPDGWWRDRDAAVRRLVDALAGLDEDVTVVLDAGPDDLVGVHGRLEVVAASRRGRNAADDEIVRLVAAAGDPGSLRVVTSDGELAARVRGLGADVVGAGEFRRRLEGR